jgi:hypothetical protein
LLELIVVLIFMFNKTAPAKRIVCESEEVRCEARAVRSARLVGGVAAKLN